MTYVFSIFYVLDLSVYFWLIKTVTELQQKNESNIILLQLQEVFDHCAFRTQYSGQQVKCLFLGANQMVAMILNCIMLSGIKMAKTNAAGTNMFEQLQKQSIAVLQLLICSQERNTNFGL